VFLEVLWVGVDLEVGFGAGRGWGFLCGLLWWWGLEQLWRGA
jgi:hypothetical protein